MNHGRHAALRLLRRAQPGTFLALREAPRFLSSSNSSKNSSSKDADSRRIEKMDPRSTEWIPPDRPLVGDKGYTHLYNQKDEEEESLTEEEELAQMEREVKLLEEEAHMTEEEQLERIEQELKIMEETAPKKKKKSQPVQQDWMKTRRETLDGGGLTPAFGRPEATLEVKHHTLLTAQEIMDFLESLGGINPNLVGDKVINEHGDTRLKGGFKGIVFVTGSSTAHIRMLATSLVEQLKQRKLQEVGVMGAKFGAEGMDDEDSTWMCIDCHNYCVNIQDAKTRRVMDLESWWSQADPLAKYPGLKHGSESELEEALDDFVADNPVPPGYGTSTIVDEVGETIHQLENKRWTAPHRAVVPKPNAGKRRTGRKNKKTRARDR